MANTYAGPLSVFPPQFALDEAGAALGVEFSRDIKAWALNDYSEMRPVEKRAGYYLKINPDSATRVLSADAREAIWRDGAESPQFEDFNFDTGNYKTTRLRRKAILGDLAIDQADFLVDAIQQRQLGQQLMTIKTKRALNALSTASWGSNTGFVNGTFGGTPGQGVTLTAGQDWSTGSRTAPNIRTGFLAAASIITKATGGAISLQDLCVVLNPDTALKMSTSAEIYDTPAQSQFAVDLLSGKGDFSTMKDQWGMPGLLYGVRMCVDRTVYNSVAFGNASNPSMSYVVPYGVAYMLYRPKGKNVVEQPDGKPYADENQIPALSTLTAFTYEDFSVEVFPDPEERRTKIMVTTDVDYQLTSPLSGFYFKNVTP